MKNKNKKWRYDDEPDLQCQFQIMGRRCQLDENVCCGKHKITFRYCEYHGREERLEDCEFLIESKSD